MHFKLAVLTYKTIHTKEPFDLVKFYEPLRTLRSSSRGLLSRTITRTVTASRAFKHSSVFVSGPKITKKDTGNRGAEVERRRRENRGAEGAEGVGCGEGVSPSPPERGLF